MKIVNHLFDFTSFNDPIILDKIIKEDNNHIELDQIIQKHEAVVVMNDLSEIVETHLKSITRFFIIKNSRKLKFDKYGYIRENQDKKKKITVDSIYI